jgi:hypothetical protein
MFKRADDAPLTCSLCWVCEVDIAFIVRKGFNYEICGGSRNDFDEFFVVVSPKTLCAGMLRFF